MDSSPAPEAGKSLAPVDRRCVQARTVGNPAGALQVFPLPAVADLPRKSQVRCASCVRSRGLPLAVAYSYSASESCPLMKVRRDQLRSRTIPMAMPCETFGCFLKPCGSVRGQKIRRPIPRVVALACEQAGISRQRGYVNSSGKPSTPCSLPVLFREELKGIVVGNRLRQAQR